MARRVIYEDGADKFFVNDEGHLEQTDYEGETYTLVDGINLEDFLSWLTDEVDKLRTAKAEATQVEK